MRFAPIVFCSIVVAAMIAPTIAGAQSPSGESPRHEIFAGSELENYLRYMQSFDTTANRQWSLRPFSPSEIDDILSHQSGGPWSRRYALPERPQSFTEFGWLRPTVSAEFNTGFPYGYNDGPVWAGKGLTTSVQAGFYLKVGVITLTIDPMVFRAENAAFTLLPSTSKCPPACANGLYPRNIDYPQRFGDKAYQRGDPGQSTLRADVFGVSAGISTANEWWGPSQIYPFLLGNNAPGFAHVFVGTARPLNVLIGDFHARVIYGRLEQSSYSPVIGSKYFISDAQAGRVRFASGLVAALEPRGFSGLELGVGRFLHAPWPSTGIPHSYLVDPFRNPFNSSLSSSGIANNQLTSVFGRWNFPHSGLEIFGEYGREDASYNFRDLVQEPDHSRSYSLGLRKTYHVQPDAFEAFHLEIMNYQLPTIARELRGEGSIYIHDELRQGHTNRGQLLGSSLGPGAAAGATLSWNRYTSSGRLTAAIERRVTQESGDFYATGNLNPRSSDVSQSFKLERVIFLHSIDLTAGVTAVREFNRDFRADAWNLNSTITASYSIK